MLTGTFVGTMIANASVLTTFLFLQHYVYMYFIQDRSTAVRQWFQIFVSSMIGFLSMAFAYPIGTNMIFDTRVVALTLLGMATEYFPVYVILAVVGTISGARFLVSVTSGAYLNLFILLTQALLLIAANKLYLERKDYATRLIVNSLIGSGWPILLMGWTGALPHEFIWQYFFLLISISVVMGLVSLVLWRDYKRHRNLRRKAETDFLTGLMNRSSMDAFLQEQYASAERLNTEMSVAILDIDHFKHVNDTYGHEIGDRVLQHAARLIQSSVRSYDQVARYGGEEFLVVFPHLNKQAASEIAERIRKSFERAAIEVSGQKVPITVSIGVASLTEGDEDDFKRIADERLYRAKRMGRNRIVLEG